MDRTIVAQCSVYVSRATAVVAELPVSRYLMGPFSTSAAHGLATLGSDEVDGLVALDYQSGHVTPLVDASFGTIVQYSAAFSCVSHSL